MLGGLQESYVVLGIEAKLTVCQASTLPSAIALETEVESCLKMYLHLFIWSCALSFSFY